MKNMKIFFQFITIIFLIHNVLSLTLDGSWIGIKYIILNISICYIKKILFI